MGPVLEDVECERCGNKDHLDHSVNKFTWRCNKCGGSSKAAIALNKAFELFPCPYCNHIQKEHYQVGWGKYKCKQCGKMCH